MKHESKGKCHRNVSCHRIFFVHLSGGLLDDREIPHPPRRFHSHGTARSCHVRMAEPMPRQQMCWQGRWLEM